jgi:hypothetical protein
VFTDETLDNALLPQGAVATATDRLRELVGQGLAEFLTTIDQINTSVQTASTAPGNWVWSMTPVARPTTGPGFTPAW